jgi:Protein of unknown function (DUF3179)
MKSLLFTVGILWLLLTEILRVYFIMPFPGSQQSDTIAAAYFIQANLGLLRLVGILLISWPLWTTLKSGTKVAKLVAGGLLLVYMGVFYLFNFKFLADKMFLQPSVKLMSDVAGNKMGGKQLVVGVFINGEAKAYPIEIIGYHHQVRDTVGGQPVMVTYCTVCRTGRVYSPTVEGQLDKFRLVGMDHFNAMFEDSRSRSWWRQVNGEAIAGEKKGQRLAEIPSQQMRLESWIRQYPQTKILQPDPIFQSKYDGMVDYDEGKEKGGLTGTDTLAWNRKSWVVGIVAGKESKAYDWVSLKKEHVINDVVDNIQLSVVLESDTASFHVWNRAIGKDTLFLVFDSQLGTWLDRKSNSIWDAAGVCLEGSHKGEVLQSIQSYQEFWHSWQTFHPQTLQYKAP